jgi:hypothetical protein
MTLSEINSSTLDSLSLSVLKMGKAEVIANNSPPGLIFLEEELEDWLGYPERRGRALRSALERQLLKEQLSQSPRWKNIKDEEEWASYAPT